jgi:hypothetical protein
MNLFRATSAIVLAFAASGCRDTLSSPLSIYDLVAVDGRPLPITFPGIDDSTTLLWGKLYLGDAKAIQVEHNRHYSPMSVPNTSEYTLSQYEDVRIRNDTIRIVSQGCITDCPANYVAIHDQSGLRLAPDTQLPDGPVYMYRLAARF